MQYRLYQKTRKKIKESLRAKITETKAGSISSHIDQHEETPVKESVEMKSPAAQENESANPSRHVYYLPRKEARFRPEQNKRKEKTDRSQDPTDLVDAIRIRSKPNQKGFLPIAMPRSDPPHEGEVTEYEYRSEFDAPEQIELANSASYGEDARTEVSELTHHTYKTFPRQASMKHTQQTRRNFQTSLTHVQEVSDERTMNHSYYNGVSEERSGYIQVDLTDLDSIHEAVGKVRSELKNEDLPCPRIEARHGLPYEETDFNADDEASEDSWGKAITRSHPQRDASIGSKLNTEEEHGEISDPPTPRSLGSDVSKLAKEALSRNGQMIIDLSEIQDKDLDAIEVLKKSPKNKESSKEWRAKDIVAGEERPQESPKSTSRSPRFKDSKAPNKSSAVPPAKSLTTGRQVDPIIIDAEQGLQPPTPKVENSKDAPTDDYLSTSMNYLKIIATGIGSQLEKLDSNLLPEAGMNSMLGVLDKDLKETSKRVPEQKEMVDLLGKQIQDQIHQTACGIDRTVRDSAKDLTFTSHSIDEMVDNVKTTYQKNLVNCGIDPVAGQAKVPYAPQTFIVPISLESHGFDPSPYVNNAIIQENRSSIRGKGTRH